MRIVLPNTRTISDETRFASEAALAARYPAPEPTVGAYDNMFLWVGPSQYQYDQVLGRWVVVAARPLRSIAFNPALGGLPDPAVMTHRPGEGFVPSEYVIVGEGMGGAIVGVQGNDYLGEYDRLEYIGGDETEPGSWVNLGRKPEPLLQGAISDRRLGPSGVARTDVEDWFVANNAANAHTGETWILSEPETVLDDDDNPVLGRDRLLQSDGTVWGFLPDPTPEPGQVIQRFLNANNGAYPPTGPSEGQGALVEWNIQTLRWGPIIEAAGGDPSLTPLAPQVNIQIQKFFEAEIPGTADANGFVPTTWDNDEYNPHDGRLILFQGYPPLLVDSANQRFNLSDDYRIKTSPVNTQCVSIEDGFIYVNSNTVENPRWLPRPGLNRTPLIICKTLPTGLTANVQVGVPFPELADYFISSIDVYNAIGQKIAVNYAQTNNVVTFTSPLTINQTIRVCANGIQLVSPINFQIDSELSLVDQEWSFLRLSWEPPRNALTVNNYTIEWRQDSAADWTAATVVDPNHELLSVDASEYIRFRVKANYSSFSSDWLYGQTNYAVLGDGTMPAESYTTGVHGNIIAGAGTSDYAKGADLYLLDTVSEVITKVELPATVPPVRFLRSFDYNNFIYFFPVDGYEIFRLDLTDNSVKIVTRLKVVDDDDDDPRNNNSEREIFLTTRRYGDTVWIIPGRLNTLFSFDLDSERTRRVYRGGRSLPEFAYIYPTDTDSRYMLIPPYAHDRFLLVDTRNRTTRTFGRTSSYATVYPFSLGTYLGKGEVYLAPFNAKQVAKVNIYRRRVEVIGPEIGNIDRDRTGDLGAYTTIVRYQNQMYLIPYYNTKFYSIDLDDFSFTEFGEGAGNLFYQSSIEGLYLLLYPLFGNRVLFLDPGNNSIQVDVVFKEDSVILFPFSASLNTTYGFTTQTRAVKISRRSI